MAEDFQRGSWELFARPMHFIKFFEILDGTIDPLLPIMLL